MGKKPDDTTGRLIPPDVLVAARASKARARLSTTYVDKNPGGTSRPRMKLLTIGLHSDRQRTAQGTTAALARTFKLLRAVTAAAELLTPLQFKEFLLVLIDMKNHGFPISDREFENAAAQIVSTGRDPMIFISAAEDEPLD